MLSLLLSLALIGTEPKELAESKFLNEFFEFKMDSDQPITFQDEEEDWYIDVPDFYLCTDESTDSLNELIDEYGFDPYSFCTTY